VTVFTGAPPVGIPIPPHSKKLPKSDDTLGKRLCYESNLFNRVFA
jgi:hypothetical protein